MNLIAIREDGTEVKSGDIIKTLDSAYIFQSATRPTEFGKSGKVFVKKDSNDVWGKELYAHIFNLKVIVK